MRFRRLSGLAGVFLAAGAGVASGETAPSREPMIYASPIHAGCTTFNARTCQIIVEPFTINLAAGRKLVAFRIEVDGVPVYDFRPDQSNPPPDSGSTYSPTNVALGFGVRCGVPHRVSLVGRDTGDASYFTLGSTSLITCPAPLPALTFHTLPPCRVIDTRNTTGPDAGSPILAAGETRGVATAQKCQIPSTAAALSVNVTVTGATASGQLTLFAADQALPGTSTISFRWNRTRANNAIIGLATDASGFKVHNSATGPVQFILDVNGYFE